MTPIEFARGHAPRHETCAGFVIRWLEALGIKTRLPTTVEILQAWREKGVLAGAEHWFALIGLERCEPGPNCVVVVEQAGGDPLVGLTDTAGMFVARSHSKMKVSKSPRIIAAWRVPHV